MKRLNLILFSIVFTLGSLSSCGDKLDINTDPFSVPKADPNALLPFVFGEYSARKVTELGTRISDVSQYISDTFNSPNRGNVPIFSYWKCMDNMVYRSFR